MAKRIFLSVLSSALCGERFTPKSDISQEVWAQVFELGRTHKVLPLIYDAAGPFLSENGVDISGIRNISKQMMFSQTLRTQAVLDVLRELYERNIPAVVVKGITCRNLYKNPDLRISADEDIYVKEPYTQLCKDALLELGFRKTSSYDDSHYQNSYSKSNGAHIELHRTLFSEDDTHLSACNEIFENAPLCTIKADNSSVPIKTFCETHNLLYLILHALKHFTHTGVGIRQICDIAVYSLFYCETIDWDYLHKTLENFRGLEFTKAVYSLAQIHLGFCFTDKLPEIFLINAPDCEPLLEDILEGGIYGTATAARSHSRSFTENAAQGKNTTLISRAFPSAKSIKTRYRYAKNPLLLPIAYAHRLIKYSAETIKYSGNDFLAPAKIGEQRLNLLRLYSVAESDKLSDK